MTLMIERFHRRNGVFSDGDGQVVSKDKSFRATSGNLDQFLQSTTPSVAVRYESKMTIKDSSTCNVEYIPYFVLGELWESFNEWSAYGTGVPLFLNGRDRVVQYYVPYLSGIQLYGESTGQHVNPRKPDEGSDGDSYRDSSSESSSDCELERGSKSSSHEGFSSDDSDGGSFQDHLLFEFFERDVPYNREPLVEKISELTSYFPRLRTLRSCDLLHGSWFSVAWYPIYRIPIGPTLRDLDACFLTYHSLSTLDGGASCHEGHPITYSDGPEDVPMISLPVFGLALYKFKGSIWSMNEGCDQKLAKSLLREADKWLRHHNISHPDYQFFVSHGAHYK